MISFVRVMSRYTAQELVSNLPNFNEPFAFISIYGDEGPLTYPDKELSQFQCRGMIEMDFWDLTPEIMDDYLRNKYPTASLFTEEHAKTTLGFLNEMHSLEEKFPLFIHCHAGISRSGAIGQFATNLFNLNVDKFKKMNPQIVPNQHIYKLLNDVAGTNFEIPPDSYILKEYWTRNMAKGKDYGKS